MSVNKNRQFPATWEGPGVDVSKDEFVKKWGKEKSKRFHVGANFKFNKDPSLNINDPAVKKYICMVGKCSGIIDKKPKEE